MPPPVTKTLTKRYPPRIPKDAYRFSDEDLSEDRDFQQGLVKLSGTRDCKILGTKVEVKSPLGPFIIPCLYQKGRMGPAILVSQPRPWEPSYVKNFFSYVCRVRTTNEYLSMPITHVQENDIPDEVNFLSGPGKGVILIKLTSREDRVIGFIASRGDRDLMRVETSRGAEQTISTAKYEVTGRGGKGRELLQRGQFTRVIPNEIENGTTD